MLRVTTYITRARGSTSGAPVEAARLIDMLSAVSTVEDMRRGNVRDVHEADGPGGCVFHAAREEIEELEIDGSVHFISYMKSAERVSA